VLCKSSFHPNIFKNSARSTSARFKLGDVSHKRQIISRRFFVSTSLVTFRLQGYNELSNFLDAPGLLHVFYVSIKIILVKQQL